MRRFLNSELGPWFVPLLLILLIAPVPAFTEPMSGGDFILVNAETGIAIRPLRDGDVIALSELPTRKLNIRADFDPSVHTAVFDFDKMRGYRTESAPPFYLAGDVGGRPKPLVLQPGEHTIEVTARGSGKPVRRGRISFSVIETIAMINTVEQTPPATSQPAEDVNARARLRDELVDPSPPEAEPPPSANDVTDAPTEGVEFVDHIRSDRRNMIFKLTNSREEVVEGQCVSFLDGEKRKLTVACTHALPGPLTATIVQGRRVVCELPVKASPPIASCPLESDESSAFLDGSLRLRLEGANGVRLSGWLR